MRLAFITFGCRLNQTEAHELEAQACAAGHEVVETTQAGWQADLIVVRGCSVTKRAQSDSEKMIAHVRAEHPHAQIVPMGCLPQAQKKLPLELNSSVQPLMRFSRASLKIQDGCNGACTFCIVPTFRGAPRSVSQASILRQARQALEAGFQELVITGCNLALWQEGTARLPELLSNLAQLPSPVPFRVRLGSLEPGLLPPRFLDVIEAHTNICRFLHLSVQSGSNRILRLMHRPYTIEQVDHFCVQACAQLGPFLALGADVIAGFPSETEEDFSATKAFLARHENLSNLHAFPYSERPGTVAASLPGALPHAIRLARAHALEVQAQAQRTAFAQRFRGRTVQVCVEKGGCHGWSEAYLPCSWPDALPRRALVTKQVVDVKGQTLMTC